MFSLDGKVILVTGASKGIGAATARAVAVLGADVVVHYGSDRLGAEAVVHDIGPDRCCAIQADFESDAEVDRLWEAAVAWRGHIDVLINNAAIMLWNGGIQEDIEVWDEVWRRTLQVNVLAVARITRAAIRHFKERGGGTVITVSSQVAHRGVTNPDTIQYAASKAAIKAMTQSIASGFARDNILAYVIAPGVVRTQMSEAFARTQGGEDVVTERLAMREWVTPEDVANVAAFLATGASRHATGTTIDVTGASYIR